MSDLSEKNGYTSFKFSRRIMRSRQRILESPMLNETPEIQSVIEGKDRLWTSNAAPIIACLF